MEINYIANRSLTEQTCLYCNNNFLARTTDVKRGRGKYCSIKCARISQGINSRGKVISERIDVLCSECNKNIQISISRFKRCRSGLFFCSRNCKDKAQRIGGIEAIQPNHYGSTVKHYLLILQRSDREYKCEKCGYCRFSILECHHKDRNRNNNNLDNLQWLCPTCHQEEHFLTKTGRYSVLGHN